MNRKLLTTLVAFGFAGAAFAQQMPAFEEVDTNSDGQISQEEAAVIEGFDFATADTNQDGSLSREEYEAASAHSE
jgi:Ca2+-binding EF-hand superfamily protein